MGNWNWWASDAYSRSGAPFTIFRSSLRRCRIVTPAQAPAQPLREGGGGREQPRTGTREGVAWRGGGRLVRLS